MAAQVAILQRANSSCPYWLGIPVRSLAGRSSLLSPENASRATSLIERESSDTVTIKKEPPLAFDHSQDHRNVLTFPS